MPKATISGRSLVSGKASGELLLSDVSLSFWGGVDPVTGVVIDQHHPLCGECVTGRVLAMPGGRGSCSGSGALLELLINDKAPAALVFSQPEEILTLGVIVAAVMFERSIPVLLLQPTDFENLQNVGAVTLENERLVLAASPAESIEHSSVSVDAQSHALDARDPLSDFAQELVLSDGDKAMLEGELGKAASVAMQVVTRMAAIQGATRLIDICQAHIDACVYHGPSSLLFARRLADWGARVKVPTTLNSLSVDRQRWQQQGVNPDFAKAASGLGDAYLEMGASPSFTCAPYLLDTAPAAGDQIVWAESNAVVYANSVLGARTQKYPDFLDACIAVTGRAPASGSHLDAGRVPGVVVTVVPLEDVDDAFWPLLGYHAGLVSGNEVPLVHGLKHMNPDADALKAFSAAFATTSSAPMVHLAGITPEATEAEHYLADRIAGGKHRQAEETITAAALLETWQQLNTATESRVDMVCLGNPHFSLTECAMLAELCKGAVKHKSTKLVVTLGRKVHELAVVSGCVATLEAFGVEFITDTCWCMITEPIVAETDRTLMTNSGKYAHYGPGLVDRKLYFDKLEACVQAAVTGRHQMRAPIWLQPD